VQHLKLCSEIGTTPKQFSCRLFAKYMHKQQIYAHRANCTHTCTSAQINLSHTFFGNISDAVSRDCISKLFSMQHIRFSQRTGSRNAKINGDKTNQIHSLTWLVTWCDETQGISNRLITRRREQFRCKSSYWGFIQKYREDWGGKILTSFSHPESNAPIPHAPSKQFISTHRNCEWY
jgi:hypothetical protein